MKWNKYPENPIPEYEDLLFVVGDAESYTWVEGAFYPRDEIVRTYSYGGGHVSISLDEILYWGRVELP